MIKQVTVILFLITVLFLSGCSNSQNSQPNKSNGKIDIYTTVYPLQYFAQEIGGTYVNAATVYPPGTDEHSFEPSQKDIIKMSNADLFLYIGYNLEGFVTKAKPILEDEGVKTIAVGESVVFDKASMNNHKEDAYANEDHNADDGHNHGDVDPHLWLDPIYASQMATTIKDALVKKMPGQSDYFEARYKKLNEKLQTLDKKLAETIKNSKTDEIIVSHGAYGYWKKRYGLKQISVTGLTGTNEPSQKDLENIVNTAKQHDLHYVVFEQNVSSKLTEIIQNEIGAKALTLHNLSVLTDADLKAGADYESLMNQNIKTLQTALNK